MKYKIILLTFTAIWLAGCSTTYVSPMAWNAVTEGMTRQDITARIGPPASLSPLADTWKSQGWELRIAYDPGGRATNIVRTKVLK